MYEIERKYLLKPAVLKFLKKTPHTCRKLTQFYTKVTPEISSRFRRVGKKYFKTVKKGQGGVREEYEKEISEKKYRKNLEKRIGYVIRKKRCLFEVEGSEYSVDIYQKPFAGLLVLEVEFSDKQAYEAFVLPEKIASLVHEEVTEDERYKNKNLALFGLPSEGQGAIDVLMQKLMKRKKEISYYRKIVLNGGSDEDLHQFRVALRTSVSLLGSCRFMCDESGCLRFKRELKEIISITNRKRDLDVMHTKLVTLEEDVKNPDLQKAFDQLHKRVSEERDREARYIKAYLQSSRFTEIMKNYKHFLKGGYRQSMTIYARYAVLPVCDYVVLTHFMKIKKRIKNISGEQDDAPLLHKLRIDFKKMRYLLENFQNFYSHNEIEKCIKEVKKLQKLLGAFHDGYQQRLIFENLRKQQKEEEVIFLLENVILPQLHTAQRKEIVPIEKRVQRFLELEPRYRALFVPPANGKI